MIRLVTSSNLRRGDLLVCSNALAVSFGAKAREDLLKELSMSITRGGGGAANAVSYLYRCGSESPDGASVAPSTWDLLCCSAC